MLIAITGHFEKPKVKRIASKLEAALKSQGIKPKKVSIASKKLSPFSLVCVVGGDGSLLRVARQSNGKVPLLGIAAGKRSYLMKVKPEKIETAARKIAQGKFKVEKRERLLGTVSGKKLPPALNELFVTPKKSGTLLELDIFAGKKIHIECDGLIIATQTGSSGHAHSAGGKKLRAKERKFIVVPSNALERKPKPFTVSSASKISVTLANKARKAEVVVDGRLRFSLRGKLKIEKAKPALFAALK